MRYLISSLWFGWMAVVAWPVSAATSGPAASIGPMSGMEANFGVAEETPNQRRKRLGQPIEASFPAGEMGERLETPNQRRHRLGQPTPAEAVFGQAEETPNHRRQRLALQEISLK